LVAKVVCQKSLVNPEDEVHKGTGWLEGRSVIDPELAVDILKESAKERKLFLQEEPLALVPLLLRCKTRLIYLCPRLVYIRMSDLPQKI